MTGIFAIRIKVQDVAFDTNREHDARVTIERFFEVLQRSGDVPVAFETALFIC